MCETSFITVTDTQMQYLATNLGFHHPSDIRGTISLGSKVLIFDSYLFIENDAKYASWFRNSLFIVV